MSQTKKRKTQVFITGIGTEVGKTIASAIITEALEADYFKPIQAGDLEYSDTDKVKGLVTNAKTIFHKNSYALRMPMSPHAAAVIDGIQISLDSIEIPHTDNFLVIEGAGGLLVPLNEEETILDIIPKEALVIVVSRHYLGSINHSLMTLQLLKDKGFNPIILFNGDEHSTTESIIKSMSKCDVLGRIADEPYFDQNVIREYADLFKERLKDLLLL